MGQIGIFFNPTQLCRIEKFQTHQICENQPNLIHMGQIGSLTCIDQ